MAIISRPLPIKSHYHCSIRVISCTLPINMVRSSFSSLPVLVGAVEFVPRSEQP